MGWGGLAGNIKVACYCMLPNGVSEPEQGFWAELRLDSNLETIDFDPPAGPRPAGEPALMLSRLESGRDPARKLGFRPGCIIA
jgi:hypothetical protein